MLPNKICLEIYNKHYDYGTQNEYFSSKSELPGISVGWLLVRLGDCYVESSLWRVKIAAPGDVGSEVTLRINLELHRDGVQVWGGERPDGVAAAIVSQGHGHGLAVVILGQHGDPVLSGKDSLL